MQNRIYQDCVEFRENSSSGVRVIRISLATPTPKVICLVEGYRQDLCTQAPMSIYIDELINLVEQAKKILERGN